jgi:hypothetical protein
MSSSDQETNIASHHRYYPPGYTSHLLHTVLIFTDLLGRIHPLALTPAWLALAAIACWPWGPFHLPVAVLSLAFTVADGTGLALLPRLGRSFGPVTPVLLALVLVHTVLTLVAGLISTTWPSLLLAASLHLAISGVFFYATWIEPFRLGVTQAGFHSPKLNGPVPLRLLHISDLHVERISAREDRLLRLVEELDPDVIVITGDYLNLSYVYDPSAQADAHDVLARICALARGPVYATTGSPPVDRSDVVPAIFEDLPITWLLDAVAAIHVNGHTIRLAGLVCTRERHLDAPRLRRLLGGRPVHEFTLLLYHSPDLMPEAVELGEVVLWTLSR